MSDMPTEETRSQVEEARALTVQERARQDVDAGRVTLLSYLVYGAGTIPPWWSVTRDIHLRKFWKTSDHLAGAVYTMQAKMTAIPFKVIPRDPANKEHVVKAEMYTRLLREASDWGEGWTVTYGKFVEDLLTQDNGGFMEIIGPGPADGPLTGAAVSVSHLDSARCTRTGNPEFPVVYESRLDGKQYKLHYTRVIATAQLPTPIEDMYGVGYCAVSRSMNIAQSLIDILTFKQEKMGSRPHRGILVTQGGLDPDEVRDSFALINEELTNEGMARYSKVAVVGSMSAPEADMKLINLSELPDGFDEENSIILGMAGIALAFGTDARELFPAIGSGATRADAMLQHLKQRGKGPGQILEVTEQAINQKYLPPYLMIRFDFQDDEEDRQASEIRKTRSDKRFNDLKTKVTDIRTERLWMVENGEITRQQFEELELADGRLEDGTDVLSLFFSKNSEISQFLDLDTPNPLNIRANDPEQMLIKIADNLADAKGRLMETQGDTARQWPVRQAISALEHLQELYEQRPPEEEQELNSPDIERRVQTRSLLNTTAEGIRGRRSQTQMNPNADEKEIGGGPQARPFEIKQDSDSEALRQYRRGLRAAITGLWRGDLDIPGYVFAMEAAVNRRFTQAWHEGAGFCGIAPDELTPQETRQLQSLIATELTFVLPLGDDIIAGNRDSGGLLSPLLRRAELWVNRLNGVRSQAQSMACADQKLKWVRHAKDSCRSCLRLEGKVKRASFWQAANIRPQHPNLACMASANGVTVCRCKWEVTDEPLSPGPLPNIP